MKQKTDEQKNSRAAIKPMNWIMRAIPALAPVPAMWSVYAAAEQKLDWPVPVAGAAALAVEGLGFASVNLAERMYTHNKSLRLDERTQKLEAPTGKAIAATGFYLIVVVAMIILVDVAPTATIFLPLAFPFLGITGAAVWAMGSEQDERERTVAEYREKKANARKKDDAHSGAGAGQSAESAGAVRTHKKRSADAGASTAEAVRTQCGALSAQYACKEAQCGWSPSVDALIASAQAGKSAKSAAASAKAGHMKNRHPKEKALAEVLFDSAVSKDVPS
jgi:Flp pilus assembly protein TadB